MTSKEGTRKVDQIRNDTVIGISPERSKLEAVAGIGLFRFLLISHSIAMAFTCRIGVILRIDTI